MNLLKFVLGIFIISLHFGCKNNSNTTYFEVSIVNFGGVNNAQINFIQSTLIENYNIDTIIIVHQNLPENAYYKPRNRYRASKLIQYI